MNLTAEQRQERKKRLEQSRINRQKKKDAQIAELVKQGWETCPKHLTSQEAMEQGISTRATLFNAQDNMAFCPACRQWVSGTQDRNKVIRMIEHLRRAKS